MANQMHQFVWVEKDPQLGPRRVWAEGSPSEWRFYAKYSMEHKWREVARPPPSWKKRANREWNKQLASSSEPAAPPDSLHSKQAA